MPEMLYSFGDTILLTAFSGLDNTLNASVHELEP